MRGLTHPGDHLLLLANARELPPRRLARIESHLADCPVCRARQSQLLSALGMLTQSDSHDIARDGLHEASPDALPDVRPAVKPDVKPVVNEDARRRLQRAMQESRAVARTPRVMPDVAASTPAMPRGLYGVVAQSVPWRSSRLASTVSLAAAAAVLILVARVAWLGIASAHPDPAAIAMRPVASLTPGAVADLNAAALCAGERPSRALTPAVREQVLSAYGMRGVAGDTYELDALITPELGGTAARENVWPQRYGSSWNAHVKDALENLLAARVCRGELPLEVAQRALADDWIASYKRYFATDAPLPAHLLATQVDEDLIVSVRLAR